MKSFVFACVFSCFICCLSYSQKSKEVDLALDALQQWYNPESGQWKTTNWWNAANIVTSLIRYSALTGSEKYLPVIDQVFEKCKRIERISNDGNKFVLENFFNSYYDDEGWWALAWIDAYNLTKNSKYLNMAKTIFTDMTTGYDDVCGGGIYWKKPKQYKNAIANGLFILTALRLMKIDMYATVNGKNVMDWANDVGIWFENSGMINESNGLVEDGLNADCTPNRGRNWTYNQGVVIASLCEAYNLTGENRWLTLAEQIAKSTLEKKIYENGILKEDVEPNFNADRTQFKGIFIRHLALLYKITQKNEYKDFIIKNADSIWNNSRNTANNQLGGVWKGPFDKADASTQSSAIDCLIEAMNLK